MDELETIAKVVAEFRPIVQADGGDIELVKVEGDWVRVRLTGACTHCAMACGTPSAVNA